jgi:hypothetical protein
MNTALVSAEISNWQLTEWTVVETCALLVGINKHGTSCWRAILEDPDSKVLVKRTTEQLRDRARNLRKLESGCSVLFHRAENRVLLSFDGLSAPVCTAADFAWVDTVLV